MSDDTCGHPTGDGSPCDNPATEGDHCWIKSHGGHAQPGRDSKLTKKRQSGIANILADGKSVEHAARAHGITPQTVYNWLQRGESDLDRDEHTIYRDFFEEIARARADGEDRYFTTVWELAREQGDHRFLASLMKQRYPDSWGDTDTGVDARKLEVHLPENALKDGQRTR